MTDIDTMTLGFVNAHHTPDLEHAALLAKPPECEAVGICPRCKGSVHEHPKGFFCGNRACTFALWKDNRFFAAKRKKLDKKAASALLSEGRVFFSNLHSEKTGKTYAAILLDDEALVIGGNYLSTQLQMEQPRDEHQFCRELFVAMCEASVGRTDPAKLVYPYDFEKADERLESSIYHASRRRNIECAHAVDNRMLQTISCGSLRGYSLNEGMRRFPRRCFPCIVKYYICDCKFELYIRAFCVRLNMDF